jgi:SAM-dependent methyltransferase
VFDAIGLAPGTTMLDAGCGSGYALTIAAARGAVITGIDASAPLIEIARERAPDADLRIGEIEDLPFDDNTFEAVTAFNAAQYAADPTRALRELRRVTVPGASVAVVTWGAPQRCDMREVLTAIGSLLPPPPPGAGGPFALSAPGALEALAEKAGLAPIQADEVPTPFVYADLETGWRATAASGPATRAIQAAGETALRHTVMPVLEKYQQPDGSIRLDNAFRYLVSKA